MVICAENFLAPPGIILLQLSIPTAMTVMTKRNGGSGDLGNAGLRSHRSEIHIRVPLTLKAHPGTVILFSMAGPKLGLSVGPRESRSLPCVSPHGAASGTRGPLCICPFQSSAGVTAYPGHISVGPLGMFLASNTHGLFASFLAHKYGFMLKKKNKKQNKKKTQLK